MRPDYEQQRALEKQRTLEQKAIALQVIAASINAQAIYNVDYEDVKFKLARAIDVDYDQATDSLPDDVRKNLWRFDLSVTPMMNGMKATRRRVQQATKANPDWDLTSILKFVEAWEPIIADMTTLKPWIIKGRKPSENSRKTPPRTLDNTGTCPACDMNVKIPGQKLYAHGFQLWGGGREGNCFCVGQPPIEISPEGAIAYLDYIRGVKVNLEKSLENLPNVDTLYTGFPPYVTKVTRGDSTFASVKRSKEYEFQSKIRQLETRIAQLEITIKEWRPRPLPDAALVPQTDAE